MTDKRPALIEQQIARARRHLLVAEKSQTDGAPLAAVYHIKQALSELVWAAKMATHCGLELE